MDDNTALGSEISQGISRRNLLRGSAVLFGAGVTATALSACTASGSTATPTAVASSGTTGSNTVDLSGVAKNLSIGLLSLDNSAAAVAVGLAYLDKMKDELGWKTQVFDIQGDPTKVPGAVSTFLSQKVDAIWGYALPGAALGTSFSEAVSAGVPVIGQATGRFEGISHEVTFDEWTSGARIANYVAQRMNFEGEVAILNWDGLAALAVRSIAFRNILAQYPGIKIVEDLQVKVPGQTEDANAKAAALLGKYPNLKAIMAGWSDVSLGANQAVKAANGSKVFVTSIDGVPAELDAIRNGDPLAATCANDQQLIMRLAALATDKILKKETLGPQTIQDSPFVSKQNVPAPNQQPAGFVTQLWQG